MDENSLKPIVKPLDRQVGGNHYKGFVIQPVEFIEKNNLGFLVGCIIKRVCRYKDKNGREDLEKAIHELELLIEIEDAKEQEFEAKRVEAQKLHREGLGYFEVPATNHTRQET